MELVKMFAPSPHPSPWWQFYSFFFRISRFSRLKLIKLSLRIIIKKKKGLMSSGFLVKSLPNLLSDSVTLKTTTIPTKTGHNHHHNLTWRQKGKWPAKTKQPITEPEPEHRSPKAQAPILQRQHSWASFRNFKHTDLTKCRQWTGEMRHFSQSSSHYWILLKNSYALLKDCWNCLYSLSKSNDTYGSVVRAQDLYPGHFCLSL